MEVKARLQGISKDMLSGNTLVTFSVKNLSSDLNEQVDKDLRLKTVLWKEKRSLDANAYAWVLMTKLAQKMGVSTESIYERFIQENPIFFEDEDGHDIRYVKSGKPIRSAEHEHWFFLKTLTVRDTKSEVVCDFDAYAKLKGSSQFSTSEMAHFIEQIIYECKENGIETMTPKEQERLLAEWEERIA